MIHHRAWFFTVMGAALTASYAVTQPVTVAYEQPVFADQRYYTQPAHTPLLSSTHNTNAAVQTLSTASVSSSDKPARRRVPARGESTIPDRSAAVTTEVTEPPTLNSKTSVPFYSQFADISDPSWQKVGCGIASLAMIIDHYKPAVAVDGLLADGISSGAYITSAGWSHAGLINLAGQYGLTGQTVGLADQSMDAAFAILKSAVADGPVMVSVHYTFEPTNPIPHLAVITGIDGETVYYNDPAEPTGGGSLSADKFKKAWKKRYIEIRPTS